MTRGGIFLRCEEYYGGAFAWDDGADPTVLTLDLYVDSAVPVKADDIIIITVTHKGAGWAAFPAGWTLICRETIGGLRTEAYWHRATDGDSGPFVITGLADSHASLAAAFGNCIKTGSPIGVSTARANASGAVGTGGITTTIDNSLIFNIGGRGELTSNVLRGFAAANLPTMFRAEYEYDSGGTKCGTALAWQMMPTAGATGATSYTMFAASNNIGLCFSLTPDPAEIPLTYDEELTGACSNTSKPNAEVIPSLSYTLAESLADGSQEVWFRFTPTSYAYASLLASVNSFYGQFFPLVELYEDAVLVKYIEVGYSQSQVMTYGLIPGHDYYIRVVNDSGLTLDQTGVEVVLQWLNLAIQSPQQGDLWITDDTSPFPSAFINPATGLIRGYHQFPASERADSLESGFVLTEDVSDRSVLKLYDRNIALIATIELGFDVAPYGFQIYGGYSDNFWVGYPVGGTLTADHKIITISTAGDIGATTWTITSTGLSGWFRAPSVNAEGTILYWANMYEIAPYHYGHKVCRYDLVNDVAMTDLAPDVDNYSIPLDRSFVMDDGSIVVPYNQYTGSGSTAFIRRYAPDGTVLNTYDFDGYDINRISLDYLNDWFWVWAFKKSDYWSHNYFFHVKASDGTIDKQFNTINQDAGYGPVQAGVDIAYWIPTSESCPLFVVRVGGPRGCFWPILLLLADDLPPCAPEKRPSTKCVTPGL
jgi:hypothetical protein